MYAAVHEIHASSAACTFCDALSSVSLWIKKELLLLKQNKSYKAPLG